MIAVKRFFLITLVLLAVTTWFADAEARSGHYYSYSRYNRGVNNVSVNADIQQLIRGDTVEIPLYFTVNGQPVDITGWSVSFIVKTNITDADSAAQLQFDYIFPANSNSQQGYGILLIPASLTANLIPGSVYLELQLTSPTVQTFQIGKVAVLDDVTQPVGDTGGMTYITSFPLTENPIFEGGSWINGGTNGLDWTDVATSGGLAYGTEIGNRDYDDSTALLTGAWGPDQTVEATIYSVNPSQSAFEEVEIRLRSHISAHSNTGYEVDFALLPAHNYLVVVRWNGALGDYTILGYLGNNTYRGVTDGDVVKATIQGNVIKAYVNGVYQGQITDNTYATGDPGMGFYLEGATGIINNYGFSSFSAKDTVE